MTAQISPYPKLQFFDNNGLPLAGGLLFTYQAGTSTLQPTYTDSTGTVANTNPVVLDSAGRANVWLGLTAYKFVLEDTFSNVIWTVDNITNQANLSTSLLVAPSQFGAVGNGIADDTAAWQEALDFVYAAGGGRIIGDRGANYLCNTIRIGGNTLIDLNNATITSNSLLAANQPVMINKNTTGSVNVTIDNNILIENGSFVCGSSTDRSVEFLSFNKCGDIMLRNVIINGPKYIGVAFAGCIGVRIIDVEATGTGKSAVTVEGGPAIWMGTSADGTNTQKVFCARLYVHDSNWSAVYANGIDIFITDPRFINVHESAVFANQASQAISIKGGTIQNVTIKNISASGIELGGIDHLVEGMKIIGVDNTCINLADCQNVTIVGNTLINARRNAVTFPSGGHIAVTALTASIPTLNITISGNSAVDYSSPSSYAVNVSGQVPGVPVQSVSITGNNFQGTAFTSGTPVLINQTYWTPTSCIYSTNNGNDDTATGCLVTQSSVQSLTSGTAANIIFNASVLNSVGPNGSVMWSGGNPTVITIPQTGKAILSAQVSFAAAAGGNRKVTFLKNGSATFNGGATSIVPSVGAGTAQTVNVSTGLIPVTIGDTIQVQALQDSGGAINTVAGANSTWVSVTMMENGTL